MYTLHWTSRKIVQSNRTPAAQMSLNQALVKACRDNDLAAARPLIRQFADVNYKEDIDSLYTLQLAAKHGNAELIRLLLEYGASASIPQYVRGAKYPFLTQNTADHPLFLAASGGFKEATLLLWDACKKVYGKENATQLALAENGFTVLHSAVTSDEPSLVVALARECNLEKVDNAGFTPLQRAYKDLRFRAAEALVAVYEQAKIPIDIQKSAHHLIVRVSC